MGVPDAGLKGGQGCPATVVWNESEPSCKSCPTISQLCDFGRVSPPLFAPADNNSYFRVVKEQDLTYSKSWGM